MIEETKLEAEARMNNRRLVASCANVAAPRREAEADDSQLPSPETAQKRRSADRRLVGARTPSPRSQMPDSPPGRGPFVERVYEIVAANITRNAVADSFGTADCLALCTG